MWGRTGVRAVLTVAAIGLTIAPAAEAGRRNQLEMYTLRGSATTIGELTAGVELAGVRRTASGLRAKAVLTAGQRAKLAAAGVRVRLTRNKKGQTVQQQAAARRPVATTSTAHGMSRAASATSCTGSPRATRRSSSSRCSARPTRVAR